MRPTRPGVLAALGLLVAAVTWGVLRVVDSRAPLVPPMPPTVPLALGFLGAGVAVSALSLRRRLRGDLDVRPADPLVAARMAALGKASSHAGAALVGVYAGMAAFLLPGAVGDVQRTRLTLAGLSVLGALALLAAGLLMEWVCRVRPPDDDNTPLASSP